jgi:hypothetical protein
MSQEQAAELAAIERQDVTLSTGASIEEIGARLALVKRALQECMEKGIDYDQVPDCGPKPVLLKPGAENTSENDSDEIPVRQWNCLQPHAE